MTRIINSIQVGSIVSIAAFVGVMICVYSSHLIVWKQLPAQDFLQWFKISSAGISNATGSTGILSLLFPLIALLVTRKSKGCSPYWLVSFLLVAAVIVITMIYFVKVNSSFADASIALQDVPKTLQTWGILHILRIILGILAAVAAGIAIIKFKSHQHAAIAQHG